MVAQPSYSPKSMTLAWEELLLRMGREGYLRPAPPNKQREWVPPQSRQGNEVEADARRAAAVLIASAQTQPLHQWGRARLFRNLPVSDVISLNFDLTWAELANARFTKRYRTHEDNLVTATEYNRLYWHLRLPEGPRVWFPNGSALPGGPKIRLGLRDFGLHMHALAQAFSAFKRWENSARNELGLTHPNRGGKELLRHFDSGAGLHFEDANHWVSRFMLQPLYILGAGLSPEEQGLWWLLVQRARNLARAEAPHEVHILLNRATATSKEKEFWNRNTEIIKPFWCEDWDNGWTQVIQIIRGNASRPLTKAAY
jgi:hypothetical protein